MTLAGKCPKYSQKPKAENSTLPRLCIKSIPFSSELLSTGSLFNKKQQLTHRAGSKTSPAPPHTLLANVLNKKGAGNRAKGKQLLLLPDLSMSTPASHLPDSVLTQPLTSRSVPHDSSRHVLLAACLRPAVHFSPSSESSPLGAEHALPGLSVSK